MAVAVVAGVGVGVGRSSAGPGSAGSAGGQTASAGAAPSPRANIVRVERPRARAATGPRVCPIPLADGRGACYGGEPVVGETAAVFDHQRYRGRIRVLAVTPAAADRCNARSAFEFTFDWVDRHGTVASPAFLMAVFGVPISSTRGALVYDLSRIRSPSGNAEERPWMALDADGDGGPDLITTAFECTASAPAAPSGVPATEVHCIDYWLRNGTGFTRARREHYYSCR